MKYLFSFIIPVYNRPKEVEELLDSLSKVKGISCCEIVIVEDGSRFSCEQVVNDFAEKLNISYYYKSNTGPGHSRNYGMKHAKGDYFLILDSDVLLPKNYLINVRNHLDERFVDCFGGSDNAHESFTSLQKAINFSMTSFLTTGGVRGRKQQKKGFQPRSFNMGLSKEAFIKSNGFSNIHPGEDPDLALRLKQMGYTTAYFSNCFVYHKRRITWVGFAEQVYKFGLVRPILNQRYPKSQKVLFYFPSLFSLGFILSILLLFLNFIWLFVAYILYFNLVFVSALFKEKSFKIALLSVIAVSVQFFSYGVAFLKSSIIINVLNRNPKKVFPFLFFKSK